MPAFADNFDEIMKRAQNGDAEAQNNLGEMYLSSRDYGEAITWFNKAAT